MKTPRSEDCATMESFTLSELLGRKRAAKTSFTNARRSLIVLSENEIGVDKEILKELGSLREALNGLQETIDAFHEGYRKLGKLKEALDLAREGDEMEKKYSETVDQAIAKLMERSSFVSRASLMATTEEGGTESSAISRGVAFLFQRTDNRYSVRN